MVVHLYIDYISQPSRAVLAFCTMNSLPVHVVETRINKLEHRTEEFAKINPMMKVPAIKDTENNLSMGESHAILLYLIRKYKIAGEMYPVTSTEKMAKIDEYLFYHNQNTRKCASLVFNLLFAPTLGVKDITFNIEQAQK